MKYSQKELDEYKSEHFKERLKFIDDYTNWLKKTPNKVWSKQQNKIINKYPFRLCALYACPSPIPKKLKIPARSGSRDAFLFSTAAFSDIIISFLNRGHG